MDLMTERSQPDGGSVKVQFGPASLIQPRVGQSDFHKTVASSVGASSETGKQNDSANPSRAQKSAGPKKLE
jgi:hypothetical protein